MKLTKKLTSLLLALTMTLSMCIFASANETQTNKPSREPVAAIAGIDSIVVNGDTAYYETDPNGKTYIRVIDQGGSEYALKHADVTINTNNSQVSISSPDMDLQNGLVLHNVDLFNKAKNLTIGGVDYVLAAGLPNGEVVIDINDPLNLTDIELAGAHAKVSAICVQNPFMGDTEQTAKWTFITYKANAKVPGIIADRNNVEATVSVKGGNSVFSGCYNGKTMNLSDSAPKMNVSNDAGDRAYYIFLVDDNMVMVHFGFDFTEAEKSPDCTGDVKKKVDQLKEDVTAFVGNGLYGERVYPAGTTVMDVMRDFAVKTEEKRPGCGYTTEIPEGCTYIKKINGIGEYTFGNMSGWMYTDDPTWIEGNKADYESWNTPPIGAADNVLSNGKGYCWFICTDFRHHSWN